MKRIHIAIITAAIMTGFGQTCRAEYQKGYTVIHVEGKAITIQKEGGEPITVNQEKPTFKVKNPVEYDAEKARIRNEIPTTGC